MKLSYKQYYDRVLGCWIGKSLGGIVGAPFEGHKIDNHKTPDKVWPDKIAPNDDLDIQVVWLEMFEERGTLVGRQDLIDYWQDRCWYNFAEYGVFLYNIQRGIHPPMSGRFTNDFYSESMGCPIRAEIWGLVSPGNPRLAAEFARLDGEQDHINESVWAEQFWAAATAAAFVSETIEQCLDAGRSVVPTCSQVHQLSVSVPARYVALHGNWRKQWKELVRTFGHRDGSKGLINFCFTLLSLYAGKENIKDTITLTVNMGWDTDCTAATAGALLGALRGASCMPKDWMKRMGPALTCDIAVRQKTELLTVFAANTCKVGLEMIRTRNPGMEISGVPTSIAGAVEKAFAGRKPRPAVEISSVYPGQPVLNAGGVSAITVTVRNTASTVQDGLLMIKPMKHLVVTPSKATLSLPPGASQTVELLVRNQAGQNIVWDKNTMDVIWTSGTAKAVTHTCGLAGAKQWRVYGPYYDIYDTTKLAECPYRNEKINANPHSIGYGEAGCHFFARLDKAYLDEGKLVVRDLPADEPYVVECGTEHLDSAQLGGFIGESVYYLVREIVAAEPFEANVNFGCDVPFIWWIDGKEVARHEHHWSWNQYDFNVRVKFDKTPRRMVFKLARHTDSFRISLTPVLTDVPGNKTVGISYFIDKAGDRVM
jgi:ADP-ribosylglycohydrolase